MGTVKWLLLIGTLTILEAQPQGLSAIVEIVPGTSHSIGGNIIIVPTLTGVTVKGQITGLTPGLHGFHIHETSDLGNGCKNAGGHFNPFNYEHGDPRDLKRHIGDLGNIEADEAGIANVYKSDSQASLDPSSKAYIGNLSIVVHSDADDLGRGNTPESLKTGNAGSRLGCGVITIQPYQEEEEPALVNIQEQDQQTSGSDNLHPAKIAFVPGSNPNITGELTILPTEGGIVINGLIAGISPGLHGFHIHEKGDLENGCKNAGGHFNPFGATHGGPQDDIRHVGDLGNIEADNTGKVYISIFDGIASLDPSSPAYIGDRAMVIHSGPDDLGKGGNAESLKTGNAGARLGCGLIEIQFQQESGQTKQQPENADQQQQEPKQIEQQTENTAIQFPQEFGQTKQQPIHANKHQQEPEQTEQQTEHLLLAQPEPKEQQARHRDQLEQTDLLPEPLEIQTQSPDPQSVIARVVLVPGSTPELAGELTVTPSQDGVLIQGQITGLTPGLHGFHVHENDDLGNGCKNAGGHFNPFGAFHGHPDDAERHVGDLGNIEADEFGTANINISDSQASLNLSSLAYIGSRAIVVHALPDDLGEGGNPESLKTGNSGARMGCGLIEVQYLQDQLESETHTEIPQGSPQEYPQLSATVVLIPGSTLELAGELMVTETEEGVIIEGQITGLTPGLHGFHIHEHGDLGNGCKNAGGHFNPFMANHGDPIDTERHVGDLGNIEADASGTANILIFDEKATLNSSSMAYIGSRAIVVHALPDDLGKGGNPESLKTGNAGARMGCGTINVTDQQRRLQENTTETEQKLLKNAKVVLVHGSAENLAGDLTVIPTIDGVVIKGQITGLTPGLHGFHIHENGDLGNSCKNAGGHFNPFAANHGGPSDVERHVGDLGNIEADASGTANVNIFDAEASLDPSSQGYVGSRAVVVHALPDDLGEGGNPESLKTGNAGARMGCGLIDVEGQLPAQPESEPKPTPEPEPEPEPERRESQPPYQQYATVVLFPGSTPELDGKLTITSTDGGVIIEGQITGLTPGLHGFHIHEKGDLGNSCKNAGGHFNPFGANHGAPNDPERHVGDLGNIETDESGTAIISIFDAEASLDPSAQAYVGSRAIVVHALPDDLGKGGDVESLKTGNAGARMGCGIIDVQKEMHQQYEAATTGSRQKRDLGTNQFLGLFDPHPLITSASRGYSSGEQTASVTIIPGTSKSVKGELEITKVRNGIVVKGVIYGLKPGLHGFHFHEIPDLGNQCKNAGPHFNPFKTNHGDLKDYHRHVGDLGNINADSSGVAHVNIFDHQGSLNPNSPAFVGNRALVVHADPDDLGRGNNEESTKTGNSGARVGCGIVTLQPKFSGVNAPFHHFSPEQGHLASGYNTQGFHGQGHSQGPGFGHLTGSFGAQSGHHQHNPQRHQPPHQNSGQHRFQPHSSNNDVPIYRPIARPQLNIGFEQVGTGHGRVNSDFEQGRYYK